MEARQLKERLEKTPGLTKTALARELGISRFELIRRLNLLRLAPEIQAQIFAMPSSLSCHCPISKRTLRNIYPHLRVLPSFAQRAPGPLPRHFTAPFLLRSFSTSRIISLLTPGQVFSRSASVKLPVKNFIASNMRSVLAPFADLTFPALSSNSIYALRIMERK